MIVMLCVACLLAGIGIGAMAYYYYADHMYRKHPEFFRMVLERKIARGKKQ